MVRKPTKTSLSHDLRAARILLDEQSTKINHLGVQGSNLMVEISRLQNKLFTAEIEIARLNGYIDRVRETEGKLRPDYEVGQARDVGDPIDYSRG